MIEVTVLEALGQDAIFRTTVPVSDVCFHVALYISKDDIPVMSHATETEASMNGNR